MVSVLRRRLSRLWDHVQSYGKRGGRVVRAVCFSSMAWAERRASPPANNDEVTKERIKSQVGLLNAIALGLLAGGVINPTLALNDAIGLKSRVLAGCIAAVLVMAGQLYLGYIPNTSSPKETDNVR